MRTVQHWRPRYLLDRSAEKLYSRIHPDAPWLTARADEILADLLRPTDIGLEFGSGRSTTWLARRISHLTSVEHDRDWQRKVSAGLQAEGIGNVTYVYAPGEVPDERGGESEYARAALRVPDQSLDLVLVDGMYRDHCAAMAIPKIKPGGLMVVDNVNWYLPSGSRSPIRARRHRVRPRRSGRRCCRPRRTGARSGPVPGSGTPQSSSNQPDLGATTPGRPRGG